MQVGILIMGRSYDVAADLPESLDLPDNATLDDALNSIGQLLANDQPLPDSCLIVLSGKHLGTVAKHEDQPLSEGEELVLIAPVAGG